MVFETIQPMLGKTLPPNAHSLTRDSDGVRDLAIVLALGCSQHDIGTLNLGPGDLATSEATLKDGPFINRERDRNCHPTCHAFLRIAVAATRNHGNEHVVRNF
jgi:hypothetical protein